MLLEGKVAIVSGIGPGMGRDISLRLAAEGADLAIGARTESRLDEVAREVEALGRRVVKVRTDISQDADCAALVERCVAELGGIDILVNNAFHNGTMKRFEDDDLDRWQEVLDVNLLGSLRLTQHAIPALKARGGGSVVMISTMSTRVANPFFASYAASKAGLNAATQALAREHGRDQIRFNCVLPGYIWGDTVRAHFERTARARGVDPQVPYDDVARQIPLGRIPDSHEIAGAVVFFASDLSSCITGQTLDVNGGQVMY